MRLKDKVIIVTGSTTGIGKAIAARCVAEGAKVVVHGRDMGRAKALAEALGDAAACIADLAEPAAAKTIVQAALAAYGRIDGLVNNAAFVVRSDIHTTDAALFDRVMAINVRAPMLLVQAALPHLAAARGSVVNIGSVNAYCGEYNLLAYAASKGALQTLSRNLGDWLLRSHGVRVNHFNVGWTLTENEYQYKLADGLPPDWPTRVSRNLLPTGRLMDPAVIASAAVYYLSDESWPVTSTVVDLEQYPVGGHTPEGKLME
jgi:NAD(P)-dependent dehydrogenase (short-subunit alcohol dehydrogenase family)